MRVESPVVPGSPPLGSTWVDESNESIVHLEISSTTHLKQVNFRGKSADSVITDCQNLERAAITVNGTNTSTLKGHEEMSERNYAKLRNDFNERKDVN